MFTKEAIEKYFMAEKAESALFMAIGISAIIAAAIFFFIIKTPLYKGAAIPLIAVGLLLGTVGFTVYKRSDEYRIRNVYAIGMNPGELKEKELPRMEKVMVNFVLYRCVEIALALLGIGLFVYFKNNEVQAFWKGFGIALALMALLALAADYFAEKRGSIYLEGLKEWGCKNEMIIKNRYWFLVIRFFSAGVLAFACSKIKCFYFRYFKSVSINNRL